jgi:hypothetical protein
MFISVPRELERLMGYGFFQCMDAFLFLFTYLPLRVAWALTKHFLLPRYKQQTNKFPWQLDLFLRYVDEFVYTIADRLGAVVLQGCRVRQCATR